MKFHIYYTYPFLDQMSLNENMTHIASSHHELLDGSGYPFGLDKSNLSIEAQIMTVAYIYSALRKEKPHKNKAFSHRKAMDLLVSLANKEKVNKEVVKILEKTEVDVFDFLFSKKIKTLFFCYVNGFLDSFCSCISFVVWCSSYREMLYVSLYNVNVNVGG